MQSAADSDANVAKPKVSSDIECSIANRQAEWSEQFPKVNGKLPTRTARISVGGSSTVDVELTPPTHADGRPLFKGAVFLLPVSVRLYSVSSNSSFELDRINCSVGGYGILSATDKKLVLRLPSFTDACDKE